MESLERFNLIDDNFGGPLVQIRSIATGEDTWCRRSRLHLVGDSYIISTGRQAELMRGVLARQKAREAVRLAKGKLAAEAKAPAAQIEEAA
jgi:hypothetical protein